MTETKRRWAIVVANEKGGVGKSTLALAITDKLAIAGYSAVVVQIDRQQRLSAALGQDVITIASDPKAARVDPGKELARFSPVLDAVARAGAAAPIVIDIGAGEVGRFCEWAALVDLDEELGEFGFDPVIFVPFTAEAEAIRQAHWTAERLTAALPHAKIILVENQRDGRITDLHPASAAWQEWSGKLEPVADRNALLVMGAIPGGSWRYFEAAGSRFIGVVNLDTPAAMQLSGLPRAEAKIARGDVAQWLVTLFDDLDRVLKSETPIHEA
ncbi:AAA family ATPase [Bradyrhizobium sp.]|jgi:PAS domain-containing protein|uniref:nucleotide-binding protein n=1 Tax=Bradyrhizobium sp. TaxID=376 RepID=UPI00391980A3